MMNVERNDIAKRNNVIKRNKEKLKKLFFKNLKGDANFITVIGAVKKAFYYFIDIIYPSFNISFEDFAEVVNRLGLYPAYDEHNLRLHLNEYKYFEKTAHKAGIIMLDPSCKFVLLLESHSFNANSMGWWGFPKEKKEPLVSYADCARQEALEETGREVEIDERNPLSSPLPGGRMMVLFFVYDWQLDSEFLPQTFNEIKSSAWFRISYLDETPSSILQETMHPVAVERIKMFIGDIRLRSNQRILADLAEPDTRPENEVAFINKKDFLF